MLISHQWQAQFDVTPIAEIELNPECRDRMIPILRGLQYLASNDCSLRVMMQVGD